MSEFAAWLPLLPFIYNYLAPTDLARFIAVFALYKFRGVPGLARYLPDIVIHGTVDGEDVVPDAPIDLADDPPRLVASLVPMCH